MDLTTILAIAGVPAVVLPYASAIVTLASVLAALLPQPAPGSVWAKPRAVLDLLAVNFGNARNADKAAS